MKKLFILWRAASDALSTGKPGIWLDRVSKYTVANGCLQATIAAAKTGDKVDKQTDDAFEKFEGAGDVVIPMELIRAIIVSDASLEQITRLSKLLEEG